MRRLLLIFGCFSLVVLAVPLVAGARHDENATIHTTIVIRPKAGDCPPNYLVFELKSGKKLPQAPQICFVRAPTSKPK